MKALSLTLLLFLSPIWPFGENPTPGSPYVIVNVETNELAFIDDNQIKKIEKVATGIGEATPIGEFTIIVKAKNPYYRKKNIQGGSPENPLGTRWIGFNAKETDGRIYGVHGTNQPESIGKKVSNGCIRMKNEVVEILYDKIPIGTKILVTNRDESFQQLAKEHHALE